jgi:hypothetical protein
MIDESKDGSFEIWEVFSKPFAKILHVSSGDENSTLGKLLETFEPF